VRSHGSQCRPRLFKYLVLFLSSEAFAACSASIVCCIGASLCSLLQWFRLLPMPMAWRYAGHSLHVSPRDPAGRQVASCSVASCCCGVVCCGVGRCMYRTARAPGRAHAWEPRINMVWLSKMCCSSVDCDQITTTTPQPTWMLSRSGLRRSGRWTARTWAKPAESQTAAPSAGARPSYLLGLGDGRVPARQCLGQRGRISAPNADRWWEILP